jgi:hypothetical protein
MEDNGGGFFTLITYNTVKTVIYRFPAGSEAEAILETIDLIFHKTDKHEEPWINGRIILTNDQAVVLLNIPDPTRAHHD